MSAKVPKFETYPAYIKKLISNKEKERIEGFTGLKDITYSILEKIEKGTMRMNDPNDPRFKICADVVKPVQAEMKKHPDDIGGGGIYQAYAALVPNLVRFNQQAQALVAGEGTIEDMVSRGYTFHLIRIGDMT